MKKLNFFLIIDEIDNFSKKTDINNKFKLFLKELVRNKIFKIQIIGIANSVEMFKGDLK